MIGLVLLRELGYVPARRDQVESRKIVTLVLVNDEEVAHGRARLAVDGGADGRNGQFASGDGRIRGTEKRGRVTVGKLSENRMARAIYALAILQHRVVGSLQRQIAPVESEPGCNDGACR